MIGTPTKFLEMDGTTVLINFANYAIVAPFQLTSFQQQIDPIVVLPGGAILDLYEAEDLPAPRQMPITVRVLLTNTSWNTTVADWQSLLQGSAGKLQARPVNSVTLYTATCYLQDVNQVDQWGNGALVDLRFTFSGGFV